MEVAFADSFKKAYRKRIKGKSVIENQYWQKLELFIADPFSPVLRTHKLSGKLKNLYSFSIEYDFRIVFYFTKDNPVKAVFVDIGTHDEVY